MPIPLLAYVTAVTDIRVLQDVSVAQLPDSQLRLPLLTADRKATRHALQSALPSRNEIHLNHMETWMLAWIGICAKEVMQRDDDPSSSGLDSGNASLMLERFRWSVLQSNNDISPGWQTKWFARPGSDVGGLWVHGRFDQETVRRLAPEEYWRFDPLYRRPCTEIRYLHCREHPRNESVAVGDWEAVNDIVSIYNRISRRR